MAEPRTTDAAPSTPTPRSPGELFRVFTALALQGFGGVLPVTQRELVERRGWLDREQFLSLLAVSQILPGPNIVNLALIFGDRHFGWRGALAAMTGVLLAPLVLVLALAVLAQQLRGQPMVADALRGMGVVAAGLVLSTAARLASGLRRNPLGLPVCCFFVALTLLVVGVLRWPLAWALLALGLAALGTAWRRLP